MAGKRTILVGTVGHGVMRSEDDGETWGNTPITRGIHSDCLIRSMAQEPGRPEIIFAGSDKGLHHSEDGGASWTLLDTPLNGSMIWELAIDPVDPNIMYAGTGTPSTPGMYRSTDRGKTWEQRPMQIAESCPAVGIPRFTGIAVDPTDHKNVWAGIEVDGVRRSTDGGDTWTEVPGALNNLDSHDIVVTDGLPKTVISVGNDELFTSTDNGETWNPIEAKEKFDWPSDRVFPRGIAIKPGDPDTIFLGIGSAPTGDNGAVMRSQDGGKTWDKKPLPVEPNSYIHTVVVQPEDPSLVLAGSRYGYLYRSDDGGDSWSKLRRELGVISTIVWVPN